MDPETSRLASCPSFQDDFLVLFVEESARAGVPSKVHKQSLLTGSFLNTHPSK